MAWSIVLAIIAIAGIGWMVVIIGLIVVAVLAIRKRLPGKRKAERIEGERTDAGPSFLPTKRSYRGCPTEVRTDVKRLDRRLDTARQQCLSAANTRITSDLARARVLPPLEDAYHQMHGEIDAICAFCERNDLAGTLQKARKSPSAQDIYMEAYQRDLAKVQDALQKTEECLAAYERTVATLEVSSTEADISSDFDASIEMLKDLRKELPLYNLEDRI